MALWNADQRRFVEAISTLSYCNPFLPERIEAEKLALADDFDPRQAEWNVRPGGDLESGNLDRILQRLGPFLESARSRLGPGAGPTELGLYEDAVLFHLYHSYRQPFQELGQRELESTAPPRVGFYPRLQEDLERFLAPTRSGPSPRSAQGLEPEHLAACFFQLRRAFHYIFNAIIGRSAATARLRATVWESIFTHDVRRYRRIFFDRMGDVSTLVTGPSGTGKELVARAIAFSQYIPLDPDTQTFRARFSDSFHALNLSALSPTLIESELFGHRKGSFTGALEDHAGWLEVCGPYGTVFLDEIGDVDASIQVKLLRVLQTRRFQRIGDTQGRVFQGKVIAATNQDLAAAMQKGRFREDLYYRLCSDRITTPSLREQIGDDPSELRELVGHIVSSWLGADAAEDHGSEVARWIQDQVGTRYGWPGNFRELEQCVRNVLIHREYPFAREPALGPQERLQAGVTSGTLTAEELLRGYCTLVYAQTRNYEETARRLKLDRRTVKAKIDPDLLAELEG